MGSLLPIIDCGNLQLLAFLSGLSSCRTDPGRFHDGAAFSHKYNNNDSNNIEQSAKF